MYVYDISTTLILVHIELKSQTSLTYPLPWFLWHRKHPLQIIHSCSAQEMCIGNCSICDIASLSLNGYWQEMTLVQYSCAILAVLIIYCFTRHHHSQAVVSAWNPPKISKVVSRFVNHTDSGKKTPPKTIGWNPKVMKGCTVFIDFGRFQSCPWPPSEWPGNWGVFLGCVQEG